MRKKLDLDFDDITSSTRTVKKDKKKKIKKQNKISDIPLSIPVDGHSLKFISKTISECTPKEFVNWSNRVAYPITIPTEHFIEEKNRVGWFLEILNFHKRNFIVSNPNTYNTHH